MWGPRGGEPPWLRATEEIRARLRWIGPGRLALGGVAAAAMVVGGVLLLRVPDPAQIGAQALAEARAAQYVSVTAPEYELVAPQADGPPDEPADGPAVSARDAAQGDASAGPAVPTVIVHVAGAVNDPGVLLLAATARVVDAVRLAGGPTPAADLHAVNLAAPLVDGQRVQIPTREQVRAGWTDTNGWSPTAVVPRTGEGAAPRDRVDINTAGVEELETLPGVGPVTAAAIVADREARGPFRRVEDLTRVRGIGPAKVAGLRDMARVR